MNFSSLLPRVMAGLDPAIHAVMKRVTAWMPGTRPGMTAAMIAEMR